MRRINGEERERVAAHDSGGGVGEPEQSDGDCDAGDGDAVAQDGVEQKREPGGGEEFGVGGALVGGVERVGVCDVEAAATSAALGGAKAARSVKAARGRRR